jgi:hypothetical protein
MTLRPLSRAWTRLRRRARLSVRVLMVFVLLIGGGLGWLVHSARVQREAVEAIKLAGGWVLYEWEEPPRKSPWPKWLYDALGQDFLDRVTEASFVGVEHELDDSVLAQFGRLSHLETLSIGSCKSMTDARMVHLNKFTQLRMLVLEACSIQGEGLRHLAKLTHLESLQMPQTAPTDSDLAWLEHLTGLKKITLSGKRLSDAGLRHLAGLTRLELLNIRGGSISSRGLSYLGGLTRLEILELSQTRVDTLDGLRSMTALEHLDLEGTRVDDSSLAAVAALRKLDTLVLNRTAVGDAGLARLAGLPHLRWLRLSGTRVTDAGIRYLGELPALEAVELYNTAITDAGLADLVLIKKNIFVSSSRATPSNPSRP